MNLGLNHIIASDLALHSPRCNYLLEENITKRDAADDVTCCHKCDTNELNDAQLS